MSEGIVKAAALSNGEYGVLLTARGGGYSAYRGVALTRWVPDPLAVADGLVFYLRDLDTHRYWLLGDGHSHIRVRHDAIEQHSDFDGLTLRCTTHVREGVAAETRTVLIHNHSGRPRRLDLTSYAELSLNSPAADAAHPAFSKLFVQTGFDAIRQALIAWRRPRSPDDEMLWVAQRLTRASQFETDRTRFIGRTRNAATALALNETTALAATTGTVLDPCFALRTSCELADGESLELELLMCAAPRREALEQLLDADTPAKAAASRDIAPLGLPPRWIPGISFDLRDAAWESSPVEPSAGASPRSDFGGFSDDGSEYVLPVSDHMEATPLPWINVVANETFGFLVSERGAGYTWAVNSRENRLTPWSNDAVTDPSGELLLLRDDETQATRSLLSGAAALGSPYQVRHGFGYSRFQHEADGLQHDVLLFVARADPLKITRVRITNTTDRARSLSLLSCAQLVLGGTPAETRATVHTRYEHGVIFATNPERAELSHRVAFAVPVCDSAVELSATGSRRSFAQNAPTLDGKFGEKLDPCAALQLRTTIGPGQTFECAFLLGEGASEAEAVDCIHRFPDIAAVDRAYEEVTRFWRQLLGAIRVQSPAPALDIIFNGWLAYQNLACRMWGRSAFYQSGGAFGFRDQLQDSSALVYLDPSITRQQIILHAAHQFQEGDVLHWWHPPTGKGIRTRFSDDLLWLPHVALFYLQCTGDHAIFDEAVGFIKGPPVELPHDEVFVWPSPSGESATLYEHCCRSIDRSLTSGQNGLPLMGVGDWNDGMNRVGREGRGESVWLGFFLADILRDFIPICARRHDAERVRRYTAFLDELQSALNDAGWDGSWYRRAYYDNGDPLGSANNEECRIDALAQAWAVISRVATEERAHQAMRAMQEHLVSTREGIIRLLTPAFDRTTNDPGYIKGYVPGVRENGGQYTHAALWAVRALAELGMRETAAPLLEMLSPVTRAAQPLVYQGEPYVIAADVYGEPPHTGRAGWTWYTGSAGWMYRVYLESILGVELQPDLIRFRPCLPVAWPGYSLQMRLPDGTAYEFMVAQTSEPSTSSHGRVVQGAIEIPLVHDGGRHRIDIQAGPDVVPRYSPSTAPLLRTTSE